MLVYTSLGLFLKDVKQAHHRAGLEFMGDINEFGILPKSTIMGWA